MPGWRVPLREATPYGQAPKYLIRDNDSKFGPCFARVATTSGIEILKTPHRAPRANAICERFLRSVLGSAWQECLDHLLILHGRQHEPHPQCICRVLQPSTTASRHPAADPRIIWIISFPRTKETGWLLFRSWPGCTMTTERLPKEGQAESTR